MSFTIGVGVLYDKHTNNKLRQLELLLAEETGNWSGLGQPPHVTVKIPFEVGSMQDVEDASNVMKKLAKKTKPFSVKLRGFGNFQDKVIYAVVNNTDGLLALSNPLINEFTRAGEPREHERKRMIFHSTLAMNLSKHQYLTGKSVLQNIHLDIEAKAIGLGLFLGIDDLQHWAVISESTFSS